MRYDTGEWVVLQERVLAWYAGHRRDLPWRETRDPYAILVSEVMLQQTQVDRVLPKYREFLRCFPDFPSLASAPAAAVIRAWSPLGYNVRAVRLQGIARLVASELGGQLPKKVDALRRLKGIGAYTAAAVACFAFGQQTPVVDTNVRRVLGRVLLGKTRPPRMETDEAARHVLPEGRASLWNQALMDLGATVCSPQRPRCQDCPVQPWCRWAAAGGPEGEAGAATAGRVLREERAPYGARPPFKGSARYYRGRIVDQLRQVPGDGAMGLNDLGAALKEGFGAQDVPWLEGLLLGLERDGLVRRDGERVRLP
ncbi:MAG: A/G-specific adenine glycosylase [Chloroflexi bacterium]|nr:A/G-specific adenine glycosylase [Chloroflexota bacterium]